MRRATHAMETATVEDGVLAITSRAALAAKIQTLRDGAYTVTIERQSATRSIEANRYYFGVVVHLISEHTGYEPTEVHDFLKSYFLSKPFILCDSHGEITGEHTVGGSTARLNKGEFYHFVERVRQWAAETLDVVIPEPDPDWWKKETVA